MVKRARPGPHPGSLAFARMLSAARGREAEFCRGKLNARKARVVPTRSSCSTNRSIWCRVYDTPPQVHDTLRAEEIGEGELHPSPSRFSDLSDS